MNEYVRPDGTGDWRNAYISAGVNTGWVPLVDALYARLIEIAPEIRVAQVKEKFGTLRFYYDLPTEVREREMENGWYRTVGEAVEKLVDSAEGASAWICEVCGAPGARTDSFGHGWLNTLCPTHAEVRRENGTPAWRQSEDAETALKVLDDYFKADEAGWDIPGGWLGWRDRAAKLTGRPTSEELKRERTASQTVS